MSGDIDARIREDNFTPQENLANNINALEMSGSPVQNMNARELHSYLLSNSTGKLPSLAFKFQ